MSDTTGAAVGEPGSVLVDARAVVQPTGVSNGVFVVGALADGLELGLGAGTAATAKGLTAAAVAPWLKPRLFSNGRSTVSLLLGAAMDLMTISNSTLGSELSFTQVFGWGSLDANVGGGLNLSTVQPVGHASVCAYITLPASLTLLVEAWSYLTSPSTGTFGQRLGLSFAGLSPVSFDLSLGVAEDPWGAQLLTWLPQVGVSATF